MRLALTRTPGNFPLAIAVSVLVVAYFSLAHQYFLLNFGARGKTYFALFLFLAWLVPLVGGTVLAMSTNNGDGGAESQVVFSLSPVPGIGMVAAPARAGLYPMAVQGPAISLPLLFLFVFNNLLVSARRRAYKTFQASTGANDGLDPVPSTTSTDASRTDAGPTLLPDGGHRMTSNVPESRSTNWATAFYIGVSLCLASGAHAQGPAPDVKPEARRLLYVAAPGIRDYLEFGGHGLLVFDIDDSHKFVKHIATAGLDARGKPLNVKGICASALTKKLYISTTQQLMCVDLITEKLLWERRYDRGCDRMSMTPDGRLIFLPSFEGPLWYVVRADDGEELGRISPDSGAHNTIAGLGGKNAYLAGLKSPFLTVVDTASHRAVRTVGPFAASIRPFTVNGRETLCFVNVNELLGFEVGDLASGQKLHRIEVAGFTKGPTKRHGCPKPWNRPDPRRKRAVADGLVQHAAAHF